MSGEITHCTTFWMPLSHCFADHFVLVWLHIELSAALVSQSVLCTSAQVFTITGPPCGKIIHSAPGTSVSFSVKHNPDFHKHWTGHC